MKSKLITEFIGTFFLVFSIACVGLNPQIGAFAPIAIAGTLMVMTYAGKDISGAHFNPAVTISVFIRGACTKKDIFLYIITQLIAGICAAYVSSGLGVLPESLESFETNTSIFIGELIFTFAICYVFLNVSTTKKLAGNSFYGIAIAGALLSGAYSVGGITGGVFNPAVAISGLILGFMQSQILVVYLFAHILAAVLAAFVYLQTVNTKAE